MRAVPEFDGMHPVPPTSGEIMRYVSLSVLCLFLALGTTRLVSAQVSDAFPDARQVDAVIAKYLNDLPKRQETDLITSDDIQGLFKELEHIGWNVSDQREINQRLLKDSDWMVKQLRTKQGTKFMRKIADFPGGYAQLDLMRESKQGQKEVAGIITTPGGEELIEFLSTSKVGHNTSKLLAAEHPKKSKLVAQRLYTKAEIAKQLNLSYAAEANRRAKAAAILNEELSEKESQDSESPTPQSSAD